MTKVVITDIFFLSLTRLGRFHVFPVQQFKQPGLRNAEFARKMKLVQPSSMQYAARILT